MSDLVRCAKCGGSMGAAGRDLVCNCGFSLKFINNIHVFSGEQVKKDSYAEHYTEDYYKCPCYDYTSYRLEKIVALARPNVGKRILDLGCGPGEIAIRCARQGAEVFGVDISLDALKLSAERAAQNDVELNLFEFDGRSLPFLDAIFDSIVLSDVVEHVEDQTLDCLFQECYRLLRPEGYVVIHTAPTLNIIKLAKILKRFSFNQADLYSRLITPQYEHLHIRYHNAKSLSKLLRKNGLHPAIWGEFQYLQNLPRMIRNISPLADQLWCLAFKKPLNLDVQGKRPYLRGVPSEIEMGKGDALYINYGLYEAEDGFRWTAKRASIFIMVQPNSSKLILELFSTQPKVEAKLSLGRHHISRFSLEKGIHKLSFPLKGIRPGVYEMKLVLDRVFVPKKEGINDDPRELGVAICKLRVQSTTPA